MARDVRRKMVEGAAQLLARQGVEGTSFGEVCALTGAPRGSLYHHFPGGKTEMLTDAVRAAGTRLLSRLELFPPQSPVELVHAFVGGWREILEESDFAAGCAIAAATIGSEPAVLTVAGDVFGYWVDAVAALFERGGTAPGPARELSLTMIAAVEGALIVGRARRSLEPFQAITTQLSALAERS